LDEIELLKVLVILFIGFFGVSILHFAVFFYDFYSAGAIQDQFTPEKIQEMLQENMNSEDLAAIRREAGAKGGVATSAAIRMKELDTMLGQGMTASLDPTIKALIGQIFPDFEGWIERNPDLAEQGLKRLQPFIENVMKGAGSNSGQQKTGGWR
jgi:hypothetical protein